ncbi:MAG: YdbL family protein [Candidatus Omnitrophica bacterium]|nr:YdbL family protein [Candidatus Omnitrophota bacterium]
MKRYLISIVVMVAVCGAVFAQSYDIKEMTPAVKSALEGRKARFSELKALKSQGLVGETNRGYVQVFGGDSTVKNLVASENKDRKAVYLAIIDQNNLGAGALDAVENVFAGVQRDKASSGDKIQDESGEWGVK